jgi:rRNA maturation RNase YbeY
MEVRVEVNFVSSKKIQQINKERRGKDYTPAVLSFGYFERVPLEKQGSERSEGPYPPKAKGSYLEPLEEGLLLGEVLICKSEAGKLARKNEITEDEQINALIIHGVKNILKDT